MINWIVDSWNPITELVYRYDARTHVWGEFTNILRVILPHSIEGKPYTMVQHGSDWYFRESANVFGGWVDLDQPWATDVVGHRLTFSNGVINKKLYSIPDVQGAIPGIMLPDKMWAAYRRGELSYG